MFYTLRSKFEKYPLLADLVYAIFFGTLSLAFGELKFGIPGVEGGQTDFREIPLIISVFYIRNPLFLIGACLITSINLRTAGDGSSITTFVMHIVPVFISWWLYNKISKTSLAVLNKGLIWVFYVAIYYVVFLTPLMLFTDKMVGINTDVTFIYYITLIGSFKFEMVSTALITGLYLVQFETRGNLANLVYERTQELDIANKTLTHLNENLDDMVQHRSAKIEKQLNMLVKYAHMNSHEVRAPLARMLGLIYIIEQDDDADDKSDLRRQLSEASHELDNVVKSMNRLLEKEIFEQRKDSNKPKEFE